MAFIAKGENVILRPGDGGVTGSYLFKMLNQDGTYSDVTWGTPISDFDTAIVSSTWTTYGAYQYLNIGLTRKSYSDVHRIDRNTRFDSLVRLSNTVVPATADLSDIVYVTAIVRGALTDDASTICQRVIDEFSAGVYDYVVAIGQMNRDIDDYRAINIDVNNIKTYAGTAMSTRDYDLPITEALYLVNVALATNATMTPITSLSVNLFQEYFIEFLGDNYVAPGSIGKTEINPDYKAERAINNYIMEIDDEHIVDGTIIISPDYTTQLDNNSIYYLRFTASSVTATHISLGYYDMESSTYVPSGTLYDCTITGTVTDKVCYAIMVDNEFIIASLV